MHSDLETFSWITLAIILGAALCTERFLVAYYTYKLAKRKGRMWLPYVLFGLLGLIVLALRAPAYSRMALHARPLPRSGYTHTGFSGPVADPGAEPEATPGKRLVPIAGYHLPRGFASQRIR